MFIHADAMAARDMHEFNAARAGLEIVERVFRIDPAFNRVFGKLNVFLVVAQFLTGGDADLLLDDVDPGDFFGDGVFDLHPRVHLDEVEFLFLFVVEEFNRSGVDIADRFGGFDGRLAHFLAQVARHGR